VTVKVEFKIKSSNSKWQSFTIL